MPRLNRYAISPSGKDAMVDRTVNIAVAHIAGLRSVLLVLSFQRSEAVLPDTQTTLFGSVR
jgi:hypothetical protein